MDARTGMPHDDSIGGLFHRLADEGKAYVRAEANLYKQIAAYRTSKAMPGIVALVATFLLVNAALVAAMVGVVLGLAKWVGPVAAGLIVLLVTAGIGYLLVRYAMTRLQALSGDAEERAALLEGERLP